MAYLATGAVWLELALTRLEQHALGHDGGAHGLVAGQHGAGQQDEASQEAADHHQTMGLHVGTLRRCEHCGGVS